MNIGGSLDVCVAATPPHSLFFMWHSTAFSSLTLTYKSTVLKNFRGQKHCLLFHLTRTALPPSVSSPRGKDITEILLSEPLLILNSAYKNQ